MAKRNKVAKNIIKYKRMCLQISLKKKKKKTPCAFAVVVKQNA